MRDDPETILGELLVLRCRRGDAEAWRQLIRTFERRLLFYIRRFVDEERDAWDVLQQTWLGVFRNLKTLREPRMLRPWLYRIARHQAISHRRRAGKEPDFADADLLDSVPDEAESSDWPDIDVEQIHQAMKRLPLAQREVLTLHCLEDATVEEIALIQGVPAGTVKSRLHYAKRALRAVPAEREVM